MADKQWGASSITRNPRITSETEDPLLDNYFNKTYTMTGWGAYNVIGAPVSPEFMYYFNQLNPGISSFTLSETQVRHLLQDGFVMHGMNNLYNMISFSADIIFQRQR